MIIEVLDFRKSKTNKTEYNKTTPDESQKFIKSQFGEYSGGGYDGYDYTKTHKGLTYQRDYARKRYAEVKLTIPNVIKTYERLIAQKRFPGEDAIAQIPQYELHRLARTVYNGFYNAPEDVPRPYPKGADFYAAVPAIEAQLPDQVKASEMLESLTARLDGMTEGERYFNSIRDAKNQLSAYVDGTFSLFNHKHDAPQQDTALKQEEVTEVRSDETTASEPKETAQYTSETVEYYPAEETKLPFDVEVQVLRTKEPEPPLDRGSALTPPRKKTHTALAHPLDASGSNYRITDDHIGEGAPLERFQRNLNAIRLLKTVEAEDRAATAEEQAVLAQYVGWGGLADFFDEKNARYLTPNLVTGQSGSVSTGGVTVVPPSIGGTAGTDSSTNGSYWTPAYTAVTEDLYYAAGHLGTLKIPAIGLTVKVYQGTDSAALAKGAGHFSSTSIWNGNVAFAAHNRGVANHFGKIHTLSIGDKITYTTKLGKGDPPTLKDLHDDLMRQKEPAAHDIALALELFTTGTLDVFAHQTNVNSRNRILCFDIQDLGENLKPIGLLVMLDAIMNRVIANRAEGKYTHVYIDEIYLFFAGSSMGGAGDNVSKYSAEFLYKCWKRFRKYYATLTGITQNVEECLRSDTARMMFANSEFLLMFNQAPNDREVLAHILNASSAQMSYVSDKPPGHGLIKVGGAIVPLVNEFPKDTSLYWLMTTKPGEG